MGTCCWQGAGSQGTKGPAEEKALHQNDTFLLENRLWPWVRDLGSGSEGHHHLDGPA